MIITSNEAKNPVMMGILIVNMISLVLAIYCAFKYMSLSFLTHRVYFRNVTVALLTLFHLVFAAFTVSDLVMIVSSTDNKVGYTIVTALNVIDTMLMEMVLVSLTGYLLNIMPGFLQGRLGYMTSIILDRGPRLSLVIFGMCAMVKTVIFCSLYDKPVLACLIARLETLLMFLVNTMHASVINVNLSKLIRSCRESKRMDQSQIQSIEKFQRIMLFGVVFLVALPVIQIIETCLYWDYYVNFAYDGFFTGSDIYAAHLAAPFLAIIICPVFLAKETSERKEEAKTNFTTSIVGTVKGEGNPNATHPNATHPNATQMVNVALQNWKNRE